MGNSSSSDRDGQGGTATHESSGSTRRSSLASSRATLTSRGLSHRITGGGSNNNAGHIGGGTGVSSGGGGGGGNGGRSTFSQHLPVSLNSLPSPFRSGGSLGLSRSELDARCQPSGLYPSCEWDTKQIRRLISNGQLASRLKGLETRLTKTDRECPICFMYYSESNVSKCCNATLCTECYLQIKPQKDKHSVCPFCNNTKMQITVQRGMDEGDVAKREEEEQRVIEATIRSRVSELNGESPGPKNNNSNDGSDGGERDRCDTGDSYGSSLAEYNRSRTRSDCSASNISDDTPGAPAIPPGTPTTTRPHSDSLDSSEALQSLAMSPADRRALESEMRAQLSHETHRRSEREAEEARARHAQEWYGSGAGVRSRMREARLAELTGLLERMTARTGGGGGLGLGGGGVAEDDNDEIGGLGSLMAGGGEGGMRGASRGGASLTRLLRAMENSNLSGSREDLMRLEAAFFLGMENDDNNTNNNSSRRSGGRANTFSGRRSSGRDRNSNNSNNDDSDDGEAMGVGDFGLGGAYGGGRPSRSTFGGSSSRNNRNSRRGLASNRGGVSTTHMDTAELLMRGVSEEEQLAMAIAMSMQDSHETQQNNSQQEGGGAGGEGAGQQQQQQASSGNNTASSTEQGGNTDVNSRMMAEIVGRNSHELVEDDSSSSSDSFDENNESSGRGNGGGNGSSSGGLLSLDSGEEEVTFTDVAEV